MTEHSVAISHPRPAKPMKRGAEIKDLKARDNATNFCFIAGIYLVIAATLAATIWSYRAVTCAGLAWQWNIPASLLAIVIIGAS